MKRVLSYTAVAAVLLFGAGCMSTNNSDTQSGGSSATADSSERGVPEVPAE